MWPKLYPGIFRQNVETRYVSWYFYDNLLCSINELPYVPVIVYHLVQIINYYTAYTKNGLYLTEPFQKCNGADL